MSPGDAPEDRRAAGASGAAVDGERAGPRSSAILARLLVAVLALGAGIAALVVAITLVRSAVG